MIDNTEDLNQENARLRARIAELEAELDRVAPSRRMRGEAREIARGIPGLLLDEATRCSRGLAAATLEGIQVSSESIDELSAELTSHDIAADPHPLGSMMVNLPKRAFIGVLKAVGHSIEGQTRTMNKFFESYNAPPKQTGTQASKSAS